MLKYLSNRRAMMTPRAAPAEGAEPQQCLPTRDDEPGEGAAGGDDEEVGAAAAEIRVGA